MEVSWTELKSFADSRKLSIQWIDLFNRYYLSAFDGYFALQCNLLKTAGDDQTDFENNYKNAGNKLLAFSTGGTFTDRSGTTSATPATSTEIMPANLNRKYLFIQNVNDAVLWINFTNAATLGQPSIEIIPGASFTLEGNSISTEAVNVVSKSASIPFTAKEK